MTQAERLIRKLCDHVYEQVQDTTKQAVEAVKTEPLPKALPADIRALAQGIRDRRRQIARAVETLQARGYSIDSDGDVAVHYQIRQARERELWAARTKRQGQIKTLETQAIVATLGQPAPVVAKVIEKLQQDLAKI